MLKELKQLIKNDEARKTKLRESGINYVYTGFVNSLYNTKKELLQP